MRTSGKLVFEALPTGDEWVLQNDVYVYYKVRGDEQVTLISAGFITDLGSRPSVAAVVVEKWGPEGPGYLLHDHQYWFQYLTRKEADTVLYEAMISYGVSRIRAWLVYRSLRLAGWKAWNDNKRRREAGENAFYRSADNLPGGS